MRKMSKAGISDQALVSYPARLCNDSVAEVLQILRRYVIHALYPSKKVVRGKIRKPIGGHSFGCLQAN